jgi:moderate conductance mechanosensitive channel
MTITAVVVSHSWAQVVPPGVCGPKTGVVCMWVYSHTGESRFWATAADWAIGRPLAVLGVLLMGWLLNWVVHRTVVRAVNRLLVKAPLAGGPTPLTDQTDGPATASAGFSAPTRDEARRATRAQAVAIAVSSSLSALIWLLVVISVLGVIGLDVEPVIAGAGLVGIAMAFGAQSLIKDLLNGVLILIEDHFGIGDEIQLGEATGVVERMTLRETVLRDSNGTVWHVRNGEIDKVGNFSQVWSVALIDVAVIHGTDVAAARGWLMEAAGRVAASSTFADDIIGEPEVLGVQALDSEGVTLRLLVRTLAGRQFALQRSLLEAINMSFTNHGVQFATQRVRISRDPPRPAMDDNGGEPSLPTGSDASAA